jgi:hypothetical protein
LKKRIIDKLFYYYSLKILNIMKMQIVNRLFKLTWLVLIAAMVMVSCDKDDDDDDTPPVVILDGYYITGAATAVTSLTDNGLMSVAKNEVTSEDRTQLREIYMAVKATDGFNIVMVSGSTQKTYGPGADFAMVAEGDLDVEEPKAGLWRGTLAETATKFTVPEDGLYHIAFDSELMMVVMARVNWGLIGAATPGGWTDDTPLPSTGFGLNSMTFEIPEVAMQENQWKFRYSGGWKIIFDADFNNGTSTAGLKVNCNFGGTTEGQFAIAPLVAGGKNFGFETYANYKMTMTWTLGTGHTASFVYVSDADPLPTYPEAMYLVGDGTAYGWDAPGGNADAIMHKCAGGAPTEGIYWKILHIEGGLGFKVSAENWGDPNLGYDQVGEFDANGVTVSSVDGNMSVATSGMYIVVLNLRDDMIKLSVKEAEVYGMGDTFGGWDEDVPANLFTIDNVAKTLTSPDLSASGNIRMYAQHDWIPSWWQAEFNVYNGVIEYRNNSDSDQDPVAGSADQSITLHFDDNTGSIQ